MNHQQKVKQALTSLIINQTFFGELIMSMPIFADPTCKTAWTDGSKIGYSPAFVDGLDLAETEALMAHEVMHPVLGHPWRREGREGPLWNECCDRALNPYLRDAGFKLPAGALFPERGEEGRSAEWMYAKRFQERQGQGGSGPGQGGNGSPDPNAPPEPGMWGEVRDAPEPAEGEDTPTQGEWEIRTLQAIQSAKGMGNSTGSLTALGEELTETRVDWKSALRRFVQESARADYSWQRPNLKYRPTLVPGLHSERMGELVLFIDCSGSVTSPMVRSFVAQAQELLDSCRPKALHVACFDEKVYAHTTFAPGDEVAMPGVPRGGGTDFRPLFPWIEEQGISPVGVIALSDLDGPFGDEPDYRVLWAAIPLYGDRRREAPWGETVKVHV